jgi:DNA-binding XRE family transcriptional regulator
MAEPRALRAIVGGSSEQPRPAVEPLWREALGRQLRARRHELGETLARTASRAGVSPQYLSEVERGRKEPSSEMIAALAGALGATLGDLTADIADELRRPRATTGPAHLPTGVVSLFLAA